jgi:hypothetical protein
MRNKIVWGACGLMVMLGAVGCGGVEEAPPENDEFQGSVEQPLYPARCQTDALGYQTGRCLDLNYLATCQLVDHKPRDMGCRTGYKFPGGLTHLCDKTYINSNYCQDPIIIE